MESAGEKPGGAFKGNYKLSKHGKFASFHCVIRLRRLIIFNMNQGILKKLRVIPH